MDLLSKSDPYLCVFIGKKLLLLPINFNQGKAVNTKYYIDKPRYTYHSLIIEGDMI